MLFRSLTSVIKDFAGCVIQRLQSVADGNFESGSYILRTADNATAYVSADDRQQLRLETLRALADAYPLMQNGTIVPMAGPAE